MLEGVHMTPRNKSAYAIFKDNGLIYGELEGMKYFLCPQGALQKIIEKHWSRVNWI